LLRAQYAFRRSVSQPLVSRPQPQKIFENLFRGPLVGLQKLKTRPKSCIDAIQVYDFATLKKDGRSWVPVFG
jgi:hypothetical protein